MFLFSSLLKTYAPLGKPLLLGANLLFVGALNTQAQTLQFEQNFAGITGSVPTHTYTGTPTIVTNGNASGNGSPSNAAYCSQTAGTNAWVLLNGGG